MLMQTQGKRLVERARNPGRQRLRLRDLVPAAIMLCVMVAGLLAATFSVSVRGEGYLVVAPPGWTLARTTGLVRAAGGRLVRPGGFSNVVIAASPDPGFGRAARGGGALFVRGISGPLGCSAPQPVSRSASRAASWHEVPARDPGKTS